VIRLRLDVMIGPASGKNWWTSGELFAFLIQSLAAFYETLWNDWHWQGFGAIWWTPDPDQFGNLDSDPGSLLVVATKVNCTWSWKSYVLLDCSLFVIFMWYVETKFFVPKNMFINRWTDWCWSLL